MKWQKKPHCRGCIKQPWSGLPKETLDTELSIELLLDLVIARYGNDVDGLTFSSPPGESDQVTLRFMPRLNHVSTPVTKCRNFGKMDTRILQFETAQLDWEEEGIVYA